jgi:cobalt-zinc-cadmium efflux system protein
LGNRLLVAVIFTGAILVAEVTGGLLSNSLALLSDAGHVFTDILALALSWFGVKQAERPASGRMTYGYHRVGILIALINAMSLVAIALVVFYGAYERFQNPPEVQSDLMLVVAVVGLAVNIGVAFYLRHAQAESLNVRSAFFHVLGDALASVGVIGAALIMRYTGLFWVDPAASVLIGVIIAFGSYTIIKEALTVFLEATPAHLDMAEVVRTICTVPGIKDCHDLHVWSISPKMHALSCHVLVDDLPISEGERIVVELNQELSQRFGIGHTAVQFEAGGCDPSHLFCDLTPGSSAGSFQAHEEEHEHSFTP